MPSAPALSVAAESFSVAADPLKRRLNSSRSRVTCSSVSPDPVHGAASRTLRRPILFCAATKASNRTYKHAPLSDIWPGCNQAPCFDGRFKSHLLGRLRGIRVLELRPRGGVPDHPRGPLIAGRHETAPTHAKDGCRHCLCKPSPTGEMARSTEPVHLAAQAAWTGDGSVLHLPIDSVAPPCRCLRLRWRFPGGVRS